MPHDEEINSLPISSLTWMAAMIGKDEEEAFEQNLIFIEYLASFINPEAVKQVREQRNLRDMSKDDDAFKKVIESISGKPAPDFENR